MGVYVSQFFTLSKLGNQLIRGFILVLDFRGFR